MDLIYMPEMLTYGSYRTSHYSDFEQPWNRNYYSNNGTSSYEQRCQRGQEVKTSSKNCHLCKESKRRTLAKYIKQKSGQQSKEVCSRICEEEEEEECDAESKNTKCLMKST